MPFLSSAPLRLDIVRYRHYGLKRRSPLSLIAPATERMGAKTCHGQLRTLFAAFNCKYLEIYKLYIYSDIIQKGEYIPRNLVGIVTYLSLTGLAPFFPSHDGSVGTSELHGPRSHFKQCTGTLPAPEPLPQASVA